MKMMMIKKMLIAVCFLCFVASLGAKEFFVSPTGNDANTGTVESPWKLINNAVKKLKSGDILYVRGGTYAERVGISVSGTSTGVITISAYSGESAIIDGSNLTMGIWDPLVQFVGSYVHMSGIEVRNSKGRGIAIDGAHSTLSNMNVHHNWMEGIVNYGLSAIVEDSRIWQNARVNSTTPGTPGSGLGTWPGAFVMGQYGTNLTRPCTGSIYRRNVVFNNWGEGLMIMSTKGVIIEENVVYNNWSVNIYVESSVDALVQRNITYTTSDSPITGSKRIPNNILLADESYSPQSKNITIINNFTFGSSSSWWNATWNTTADIMENVLIANNTFAGGFSLGTTISPAKHSNVRVINNIFPPGTQTTSGSGITYANNIVGGTGLSKTGLFSNTGWSTDYFKLTAVATSAINKATVLSEVTDDFFKTARDSSPDIGAHEYTIQTGIAINEEYNSISIYPNPVNTLFTLTISPQTILRNAEMRIYDMLGKEVKTISISHYETTVERGDLQSGIYNYCIVSNSEIIENGKLVVQ